MEQIVNFLTGNKIPIGAWGKEFFTFLTDEFRVVLRFNRARR